MSNTSLADELPVEENRKIEELTTKKRPSPATSEDEEPGSQTKKIKSRKIKGHGWLLFSSLLRSQIKIGHQQATFSDISRILGKKWKSLSDAEKSVWNMKAAKEATKQAEVTAAANIPVVVRTPEEIEKRAEFLKASGQSLLEAIAEGPHFKERKRNTSITVDCLYNTRDIFMGLGTQVKPGKKKAKGSFSNQFSAEEAQRWLGLLKQFQVLKGNNRSVYENYLRPPGTVTGEICCLTATIEFSKALPDIEGSVGGWTLELTASSYLPDGGFNGFETNYGGVGAFGYGVFTGY